MDPRLASARKRHADPAGGCGLHGQCVDTHGPPGLRHPPPHAQRGRGDGARARVVRQVTLLGPLDGVDLAAEVGAFGVDGPVALVTAGWEEGERNDADADRRLGGGSRNLNLYGRHLDVLESDAGYADAQRLLRTQLDELREVYLLRLRRALAGVEVVRRRSAEGSELDAAIDAVRALDESHAAAIATAYDRFYSLN